MKLQYVAKDGKVYETEKACLSHENYLDKLANEKEAAKKELERRLKEIHDAYDKYNELYDKFVKDYPDRNTSLFDYLFYI